MGSEFRVKIDCGDLKLFIYRQDIAWFFDFEQNKFDFRSTANYDWGIKLIKEDIIKKFYKKGIELLSKYGPKYTVQVIAQSDEGYLNFRKETKKYFVSDTYESDIIKTQFTMEEINTAKKNINLAIDWNKAIIKEVE